VLTTSRHGRPLPPPSGKTRSHGMHYEQFCALPPMLLPCMLGRLPSTSSSNDSEAPFSMLFGTQQHQPKPSNQPICSELGCASSTMVLHLFCKAFKMSAHSWPPSINYLFPQLCARTSKVCSLSVMIIHFCKALCLACLLLNMPSLPSQQMQSW